MIRRVLPAILMLAALAAVAAAQSSPTLTPGTPAEVRAFADALDGCTAGKVAARHPLMTSFIVEHAVTGAKNDLCVYSQTMPAKMRMECAFTAAGRKAMAADIRASAAGGPVGGGTSRAQPAWATECDIVTASGSRSPMTPPAR